MLGALQCTLHLQLLFLCVAQSTIEAWRVVFYISAYLYVFSTIFYGLFASGERQPWASSESVDDKPSVNTKYGTQQDDKQQ